MFVSFLHSLTFEADSGHKLFLEDAFENQSRIPGGNYGPASVPYTDVVIAVYSFFINR